MKKPICTTASARAFLIGDEKCGLGAVASRAQYINANSLIRNELMKFCVVPAGPFRKPLKFLFAAIRALTFFCQVYNHALSNLLKVPSFTA
ncbi:MAG: hypothetical protein A2Z83_08790 [Omnitrophica bacterium GWA2_52_8]|nr:MAG: hypothetical protein A2Z83_08790 [Omnitrophica bacterium GWA2_52_8]